MEKPTKRKLDFETDEYDKENLAKRPKTEKSTVRNGTNLEASLSLLQRDGRSIKKLCIEYHVTEIKPLLDAIIKYCGNNVTEIEFIRDYGRGELRNTNQYRNGLNDFRSFLRGFEKRFPNLISLKIAYREKPGPSDIKHWDEIMQTFPLLKCLIIEKCPKFPLDNFFRVNGQLERLILNNTPEWRINREFLETVDSLLPNLKYLEMEFVNAHTPMHAQPFGQYYFKNLETLKARSYNKEYANVLRFLSPSGEKLEEFAFNVGGNLDEKAIKMLSNYKQLKRIQFNTCLTNKQLPLLAAQVPQIEVLTMNFKKKAVTGLGIVKLIGDCKQLTKIVMYPGFKIYDEDIEALCNPIKNKMKGTSWSVGDDGGGTIEIIKKNQN